MFVQTDHISSTFLFDRLIEKQKSEIRQRQIQNANSKAFDFENFHVYSEVIEWSIWRKNVIWRINIELRLFLVGSIHGRNGRQ